MSDLRLALASVGLFKAGEEPCPKCGTVKSASARCTPCRDRKVVRKTVKPAWMVRDERRFA